MEVLLFGMIAEKAGTSSIEMEAGSIAELQRVLIARIPDLDRMSYAIAVDRAVVKTDRTLSGTEEVAVLPPFAGG